ncbi:MAG: hypothetical protein IPM29_09390 [Planctomycetes bacterium]|nr:hypothetical protein [Planctomycetota bacterium]
MVALADASRDALARGERDAAVLALWDAEALLGERAAGEREAAQERAIAELRGLVDPLATARRERDVAAAAELTELARLYQRRRMWRRALDLLREAGRLDPESVQKALPYAERKAAEAVTAAARVAAGAGERRGAAGARIAATTGGGGAELLPELLPGAVLPRLTTRYVSAGWSLGASEVRSPRIEDGESALAIGASPEHGDERIEVEILIGDVPGSAALMFGVRDVEDYYLLQLTHNATVNGRVGWVSVDLYRFAGQGGVLQALTSAEVPSSGATRSDWERIGAVVDGRIVTLEFAGRPVGRWECPTVPHGSVGLYVSGNTPNREPVGFRRLTIGPPTPRVLQSAAAEQAASADAAAVAAWRAELAAATAGAEAADADREGALRQIEALRRTIFARIPERASRDLLRAECDAALDRVDPVHAAAARTMRGLAGSLVDLAARYREAGLPLAAARLLDRAAAHDESATDAERRALQPAIDAVAAARREAELAASALDNRLLNEWFRGADQHFGPPGWIVDRQGATSPRLDREFALLIGRVDPALPATARLQVALGPAADGQVAGGLAFGVRGENAFTIAIVNRVDERVTVTVAECRGATFRQLGRVTATPRLAPGESLDVLPLELDITATRIRAAVTLPDGPEVVYEGGDVPIGGRLGLFAEIRAPGEAVVRLSGFGFDTHGDDR